MDVASKQILKVGLKLWSLGVSLMNPDQSDFVRFGQAGPGVKSHTVEDTVRQGQGEHVGSKVSLETIISGNNSRNSKTMQFIIIYQADDVECSVVVVQ